jgi:hypothetical protein
MSIQHEGTKPDTKARKKVFQKITWLHIQNCKNLSWECGSYSWLRVDLFSFQPIFQQPGNLLTSKRWTKARRGDFISACPAVGGDWGFRITALVWNETASPIGNRQSAIGNRQSAIGNPQSAIGNPQSAICPRAASSRCLASRIALKTVCCNVFAHLDRNQ